MQNSLSPRPLIMSVYHNYTIRRTGGLDNSPPVPLNVLTVPTVAKGR